MKVMEMPIFFPPGDLTTITVLQLAVAEVS
jgi:hypothetical protein